MNDPPAGGIGYKTSQSLDRFGIASRGIDKVQRPQPFGLLAVLLIALIVLIVTTSVKCPTTRQISLIPRPAGETPIWSWTRLYAIPRRFRRQQTWQHDGKWYKRRHQRRPEHGQRLAVRPMRWACSAVNPVDDCVAVLPVGFFFDGLVSGRGLQPYTLMVQRGHRDSQRAPHTVSTRGPRSIDSIATRRLAAKRGGIGCSRFC
jgi:hypothetical protein